MQGLYKKTQGGERENLDINEAVDEMNLILIYYSKDK
jgi:hypothetical protein